MYQNPHNESLVREIDMMNKKKVRNIQAIDEGAGYSGGRMARMSDMAIKPMPSMDVVELKRTIGGKRGRPKKAKMQGEGFWSDFGDGFIKGFTGAADVASKVVPFLGLGKGQRKYKKQQEAPLTCGGSGFRAGTFMDTGFEKTEGAGFSGGAKKEAIIKLFFSSGKAKKMKDKLEGAGFWSDFADGFVKGFTGAADVAGKVLPVVAPFIGLGKSKMTTRTDLEQMGRYVPDKMVERSQMVGSDMSGFGKPKRMKKMKCMSGGMCGGMCGGADTPEQKIAKKIMNRKLGEMGVQEKGISKMVASYLSPTTPPQRTRSLAPPPAPKRRKQGMGRCGGRRTEMEGDFSGMGISGGKKAPNAWIQLVSKVRREQGLKSVKEAIAYIKEKGLYNKK